MIPSEREDYKSIARILKGDEQALDAFVDEYYPRLYRFAFPRLSKNIEATQDVVQGTFEKVIPKLSAYRGEAAVFSWMCSFCNFEIAAYWRAQAKKGPEVELVEDIPGVRSALESLAIAEDGPELRLRRQEVAHLVRTVLDYLPTRYGNALEWKYLGELSVVEIASRLGVSAKAAESVLTRARKAFRDGFTEVIGGART